MDGGEEMNANTAKIVDARRKSWEGNLVLTLVHRGRHDGEEEVVSCYEAADRGERTAGVEGREWVEARLDHIDRIDGVARGFQLDPRSRKSCSSRNVMALEEELTGEERQPEGASIMRQDNNPDPRGA